MILRKFPLSYNLSAGFFPKQNQVEFIYNAILILLLVIEREFYNIIFQLTE